jgi:hypothetical protein
MRKRSYMIQTVQNFLTEKEVAKQISVSLASL